MSRDLREIANDRSATIREIRDALRRRTGRSWSVTGGRGTGAAWLHIDAPPARRECDSHGFRVLSGKDYRSRFWRGPASAVEPEESGTFGYTCADDRRVLGEALGLGRPTHAQGQQVPPGPGCREEYIDRANGRKPSRGCTRDWD